MGFFRFRKVLSLGRFLKLNLSKTGVSASVGRPGATLNVRKDRVDGTVGVPGTLILNTRITAMMLARQMSAMPGVSPWQKRPVADSLTSRCSTAANPVPNHCVCQARQAASSKPAVPVR